MPRPRSGRPAPRRSSTVLDAKTRALLAAWCHAGPPFDSMGDPSEASWNLVREDVWRRWVAETKTFSSPGYAPLPYAAILYDDVPEDVSKVPMFAMPALAEWSKDQRTFRARRIVPEGLTTEEAQDYLLAWIREH
jgi:hypothetical protein